MRIPPLVLSCALLACTQALLSAQDLQYRAKIQISIPNMPLDLDMPSPDATTFMKGTSMRLDMRMGQISKTTIMDGAARKMYRIDHAQRTYTDETMPSSIDTLLAKGDTASIRELGVVPKLTKTGDKRTILGYETTRVLSVQRFPHPAEPNAFIVLVAESWATEDPQLMKAFEALGAAAKASGSGLPELAAMMGAETEGVPLETEMVMLTQTGNAPIDPVAIIKNPGMAGFMSRTRMQVLEIKVLSLPDSLFQVPAGYRRTN